MIIAAAVIFKLVGRKLNSATQDEVFPTILMDKEDVHIPLEEEDSKVLPKAVVVDEPIFEEAQRSMPVKQEAKEPVVTPKKENAPILQEEQPQKKEKIDPKKLVVYSEIMKPKYFE